MPLAVYAKRIFGAIMFYSGIFYIARYLNSRKNMVPILMYHKIPEAQDSLRRRTCLELIGMAVPKDRFKKQIEFIVKHYKVISLESYIEFRKNGSTGNLPSNPIVITFDDGFADNYSNALPVLELYDCPATFFLIGNAMKTEGEVWVHKLYHAIDNLGDVEVKPTVYDGVNERGRLSSKFYKKTFLRAVRKLLDAASLDSEKKTILKKLSRIQPTEESSNKVSNYKDEYMSYNQVKDLITRGFSIGGHSMTHEDLVRLDAKQRRREIFESKKFIDEILNYENASAFAYPFGHRNTFNKETRNLLADAGFVCALTTIEGINTMQTDIYELQRIEVGDFSNYELLLHTTGLIGWIKGIGRRLFRHKDENISTETCYV